MKANFTYRNRRILLALVTFILIVILLAVGSGFSRYRTQKAVANRVDYNNTLAESFKLLDKPIKQLGDGSYAVDDSADAEPTDGYTFKLIPGITLPASPYIELKGKTAVPAYLYLEVRSAAGVTLTFDSKWSKLSSISGKKGGDIYVYDSGNALTGDGGEEVLKMPTFTIDTLSRTPGDLTEGEIKVYAYLMQKTDDKNAADVYADAPEL